MPKTNACKQHTILGRRNLILVASTAILGATVLLIGPGGSGSTSLPTSSISSARAADATITHPASFADLVAKVKPAVISVQVKIDNSAKLTGMNQNGNGHIPSAPGSPMDKFFQQFGFQNLPNGMTHQLITGVGSGFFISPDGYAVTNNHVVDSAKSVKVTTDDGTIYTAKVIGTDPKTDVALIKVNGKNDFPYVKFADHEPRIGDWVVAVGNPFGLGGTVTTTLTVALGEMPNEKQANAATENPKPADGVPYLGLMLAPADEMVSSGNKGVVVTGVDPNGAAAQEGFQAGNVILDVGGKGVASAGDVRNALIDAKNQGKHDVLMRVKTGDATKFVAVPIGQKAG